MLLKLSVGASSRILAGFTATVGKFSQRNFHHLLSILSTRYSTLSAVDTWFNQPYVQSI